MLFLVVFGKIDQDEDAYDVSNGIRVSCGMVRVVRPRYSLFCWPSLYILDLIAKL